MSSKINNVNIINVTKILNDMQMESMEGQYIPEKHYNNIINSDTDAIKADGTYLFRFRKGVIPICLINQAVTSLKTVSMKKHDNRGAPAGVLNIRKMPNYVGKWFKQLKFRTYFYKKSDGKLSKHDISNLAPSNIIGFFDRKDRNDPKGLPCRLTAFSKQECDKWNKTIPLIKHINSEFKRLMPDAYKIQLERANLSKEYIIDDTCFSTITTNYSWRTACHVDRGDYPMGFGNLIVCEDIENPNIYSGCYLGFPQYGICVNVRNTDFLAMDVHEWHCNTEFKSSQSPKPYAKFKSIDFNNDWFYNRLSLVCYLRKNMYKCNERIKKVKENKNV